jgi:outer membrane protein OmpA-like peptidoglycan-associated protein
MAANLMEMMQSTLAPMLARDASRFLGESESSTRAAVDTALPALLGGLMQKASTAEGASSLFNLLNGSSVDSQTASNLGSSLNGTQANTLLKAGAGFMSTLFGSKTGTLIETLSSITGLKSGAATNLLSIAAPAVLGFVKNYMNTHRLDVSRLANLLLGQRDFLGGLLDNRITNALGLGSASSFLASLASKCYGAVSNAGAAPLSAAALGTSTAGAGAMRYTGQSAAELPRAAVRDERHVTAPGFNLRRWLPWLVLGALALWLLPQLFRLGQQPESTVSAVPATAVRTLKSIQLPDGTTLQVREGGFFDSLVAYLNSNDAAVGRGFVFEELNFNTGSATLTGDASSTIQTTAAVLKAFPGAQVRIEGHTDNVGDPAANKQLSADRAAAVAKGVQDLGIPAARIQSTGWGEEKPVASNDSEDGRAQNRRMEIVITKR